MRQRKGFTLIELLVVVAIIALLIGILLPSLSRAREVANRTVSASNLSGIYKALYQYSVSNDDSFPKYNSGGGSTVRGFQKLRPDNNPDMSNNGPLARNVTASLWILVRNGSSAAKQFINPSDKGGTADDLSEGAGSNNTHPLSVTWDFWAPENLSYSTINMYDNVASRNWSAKVKPDYVIMGDDNNADEDSDAPLHTMSMQQYQSNDNLTNDDLAQSENSQNHSQGEGGNFLFGDGHCDFENHPFVGRNNDNANAVANNAMPVNGDPSGYDPNNGVVTLDKNEIDRQNREFDAALLPISGNDLSDNEKLAGQAANN